MELGFTLKACKSPPKNVTPSKNPHHHHQEHHIITSTTTISSPPPPPLLQNSTTKTTTTSYPTDWAFPDCLMGPD
jgi:hypothetical protein